ncbi:PREDICTED: glutamic acid-rich protein-like [Nicrophorus vespilloides]|uniref:Glutamic acid-rich protein-like n=1 Tax=Nicrophorus vespilloides TaxID=110193 RepID=A0ABM1MSS7_NICVS|nr:PREDICTED: glutamic acid-rich protein-like [Nicrophorus vespilloides]
MRTYGFLLIQLILCSSSFGLGEIKRDVKISDVYNTADANIVKDNDKSYRQVSTSKRESEEEAAQPLKLPKINTQGTQCYDVSSAKRSADSEPDLEARYKPIIINEKNKKRRSPFGIVYNQGRPIGILEPISKMYEFQEYPVEKVNEAPLLKRNAEDVSSMAEGNGKYASILTSFKIGNRMKVKQLGDEAPFAQSSQEKKQKAKRSAEKSHQNLNEIENNLKEIMGDLGLINQNSLKDDSKREAAEDEDLDAGLNKIGLTKESHSERNKKEDCPGKTSDLTTRTASKQLKNSEIPINGDANFRDEKQSKKNKISDFRADGEAFIRKKRQQANDLMKGLETSGDLTVSGNKSPLASSSTAAEAEGKQKVTEKDEKRDKQIATENQEYEKRLQRNIEHKISEIKEQVKREIKALKEKHPEHKVKADEKKSEKKKREEKKGVRKKRNLLDKEIKILNPVNTDEHQEPHIRKRRDAAAIDDKEEQEEQLNEGPDKRVTWKELDTADLQKRSEPGKKMIHNNPKSYEYEYRTKKEVDKGSAAISAAAVATEELKEKKVQEDESGEAEAAEDMGEVAAKLNEESSKAEGFQDVQNQDVAKLAEPQANHALAARGSTAKNAHAIANRPFKSDEFDAAKLEHLVSESTSLTQSVKNERGTRSGNSPKIEVELHSGKNDMIKANPEKKQAELQENKGDAEIAKRSEKRSNFDQKIIKEKSDAKVDTQTKEALSKRSAKLEPEISLEDMQQLDSENTEKRRKRTNSRVKRNDYVEPNNMQFRTYRSDEDEADDESDEFDDDNFDDRTANLIRKRDATNDGSNYDEFDEDYEVNRRNPVQLSKRNAHLQKYVDELNSDAYSNQNYLYNGNLRKKRENFDDLAAIHSGGPMMRHMAAARERNMQPLDSTYRRKRLEKLNSMQNRDQTITGLSESDIFGGLPQSYEGELSRFKRVKRGIN